MLRRTKPENRPRFDVAGLRFDESRLRLERDGVPIDLTGTEFQILVTLARRPGRVFTRAQLLDAVHGDAVEAFDRAIDAHVKNIRRKVEHDPRRPAYVLTVYGLGYKFADL